MAARTNLVLKDQAATPANRTFTPDGDDANGVHVFSEKTGIPAANPRFTAALKRQGSKYKASLKLTLPVAQTQVINGVSNPVIVRTSQANLEFFFDELSTEQERKDTVAMVRESLAVSQTQLTDMITGLSDIY